jgi:hypothetical protein
MEEKNTIPSKPLHEGLEKAQTKPVNNTPPPPPPPAPEKPPIPIPTPQKETPPEKQE